MKSTIKSQKNDSFDIDPNDTDASFYLRFYSGGYKEKSYGHEFFEFDLRYIRGDDHATIRYANQSNYRDEELIKKTVCISKLILEEFKRIVRESQILLESDKSWPRPTRESKQELEVRYGNNYKVLKAPNLLSMSKIQKLPHAEGLKSFYYLVQDLKVFVFSLISLHFKVKPVH